MRATSPSICPSGRVEGCICCLGTHPRFTNIRPLTQLRERERREREREREKRERGMERRERERVSEDSFAINFLTLSPGNGKV